jgi:hypothetical protein
MRRPSGQGPGARLFNGLASQVEPASRAARAHRPSPAPRGNDQPPRPRTAPQSGSDLRQPATRSPAPNSRGSATAPARRLFRRNRTVASCRQPWPDKPSICVNRRPGSACVAQRLSPLAPLLAPRIQQPSTVKLQMCIPADSVATSVMCLLPQCRRRSASSWRTLAPECSPQWLRSAMGQTR